MPNRTPKRFADSLFSTGSDGCSVDLFEQPANAEAANRMAGRSVAALDRDGDGRYGFLVASHGGPFRLYEVAEDGVVADRAVEAGLAYAAGVRSLACLPLLSESAMDVVAGNEGGPNFVFRHAGYGRYDEVAAVAGLADRTGSRAVRAAYCEIEAPVAVDVDRRQAPGFFDVAPAALAAPSKVRTVIAADFDNDGEVELFFNNLVSRTTSSPGGMGAGCRSGAARPSNRPGSGTGAAVADIDGDGVLELLVAHGESSPQPLSLYKVPGAARNGWIRVLPRTRQGAPARGAVVRVHAGGRQHVRAIDAGSGYLGQTEPVAHIGLGNELLVDRVEVSWPDGSTRVVEHPPAGRVLEVPHP